MKLIPWLKTSLNFYSIFYIKTKQKYFLLKIIVHIFYNHLLIFLNWYKCQSSLHIIKHSIVFINSSFQKINKTTHFYFWSYLNFPLKFEFLKLFCFIICHYRLLSLYFCFDKKFYIQNVRLKQTKDQLCHQSHGSFWGNTKNYISS